MLVELPRKVYRRISSTIADTRERRRLAPLYQPDPSDLDREKHLQEALDWLKRAQDAGDDRGVSYGVKFGEDFDRSYPETTGYICQTFVEQAKRTGESDLIDRATQMADWEVTIQLPDGAVMGGKAGNPNPTPAVFNTGMVLLGWAALTNLTKTDRYTKAIRRACDWLVEMQEPDGNWIRGNSRFAAQGATLYNVKAAWGLCEAGFAIGEDRYVQAAIKNAEYCAAQQRSNGWFPNCCLTDPVNPLLHTIAYTMQGLVGIAKLTNRRDFFAVAQKTADAEMRIMSQDGFLPGRQTSNFDASVKWCCLTGSAQTSSVWSEFYMLNRDEKYRKAARQINRYLMAHHDIRNPDARLRGGVPGSWPVWGDYGELRILNWATKFFVDALILQGDIETLDAGNLAIKAGSSASNWFMAARSVLGQFLTPAKSALRSSYRRARGQYAKWFGFGPAQLLGALKTLGVQPGDALLVHSGMEAFWAWKGSVPEIIAVLKEAVGSTGTLILPTFSVVRTAVDLAKSGAVFDPRLTPSRTGLISEVFRRSPDVLRSIHATHSVAVWGADKEWWIENHHLAETPCGRGTPFFRLLEKHGKIVLAGVDISTLTFFHCAEELLEPEMPFSPFTAERYVLTCRVNGAILKTASMRLYAPEISKRRALGILEMELKRRGFWRQHRVGSLTIVVLTANQILDTLKDLSSRRIFCYQR